MNTKHPFRPPECKVQEVNYGNTVLVQQGNAVWLLGYIQDIDNDQIYVDFDSSVMGACWIPSWNVWSHRFIDEHLPSQPGIPWTVEFVAPLHEATKDIATGTFSVQVALRDENNGAYRFRSATLISGFGFYKLYCVKLDAESGETAAVGEAARYIIVHRWQIVAKLPLDESSLSNKSTGQVYRKHVVKLTTDHDHPVEVADAYRMYTCLLDARGTMPGFKYPLNYRSYRFFAKISVGFVEFVCAEFHNDTLERSMCWSTDSLQQVCEEYWATSRQYGFSAAPKQRTTPCRSLDKEAKDLRICDLLLMKVFSQLDLYAQTKIKRVCSHWYNLLTGVEASLHITIDGKVQKTEHTPLDDKDMRTWTSYKQGMQCHYTYKLGWILNRAVNPYTRTLTIINTNACAFAKKTGIIAEILKLKNVKLRVILIKDSTSWFGIGKSSEHLDQRDVEYNCGELSTLINFCDLLVVENYTIKNILRFTSEMFLVDGSEVSWPFNEGRYVRTESIGCICGAQSLRVFIPRLRFRSTDSTRQMLLNLLSVAENNCRPVTVTTVDKVKGIHNRWVQTFLSVHEYARFRDLLKIYNGFHSDGSPQVWDGVDLSTIDVSGLTKLTLLALDAFYIK